MKAVKVYSNNSVSTVFRMEGKLSSSVPVLALESGPGMRLTRAELKKHITFRMNFRPNSFNF